MNRNKSNELSAKGYARKQEMLKKVQQQMDIRRIRKQTLQRAIGATALLAIGLLASTAWFSRLENRPATFVDNANSVSLGPKFAFATVEKNRQDITHRYVATLTESRLSFESLTDDELRMALKSTGDQLVLAEINGEKMLLPSRLAP